MSLPSAAEDLLRPAMPTRRDQRRWEIQRARYQLLTEDHDEIVAEWIRLHIGEQRAQAWGIADTSVNSIAHICRQLSTPGLYGKRPDVRHQSGANEILIGSGGLLDRAGYFTRMQRVQYFALGMGDFFLRPDVNLQTGELIFRNVLPQDVYLEADPDQSDRPTRLWELRARWWADAERWVYAWDQYDIGRVDPVTGEIEREPSYRVVAPGIYDDGSDGDLSNIFLGVEGGLVGDAYPYRDKSGRPVLPFVHYRSGDPGTLWNYLEKRGATRGALNGFLYHTYAGHCARDASGTSVIAAGLLPMGGDVHEAGKDGAIVTIEIEPGAILYHEVAPGAQPFVREVGPGGNLQQVSDFAQAYTIMQAVHWGLNPADLKRQHANPASGQALFLSNKQKREAAAMVEPLFRQADLQAIRLAVIVLRAAGVPGAESLDEDGYTILYPEIPESPQEEQERRAKTDWAIERGFLSEITAYQRWHPGASRDDAIEALVQSRTDEAIVRRLTEERLAQVAPDLAQTDDANELGSPTFDSDSDNGASV